MATAILLVFCVALVCVLVVLSVRLSSDGDGIKGIAMQVYYQYYKFSVFKLYLFLSTFLQSVIHWNAFKRVSITFASFLQSFEWTLMSIYTTIRFLKTS